MILDENVRQRDPAERGALGQLRNGDVDQAVAWYARNQRITVASTTHDALNGMVNAWTADTCSGLNSGVYAWRRDNVAALNRLARAAWAANERLNGPEIEAPGGRRYAAGDRIVTLAPGAAGGAIVTSERGVVTAGDADRCQLVARMDDGRDQLFAAEHLSVDRLDYGYATTVHRAQGATVDTGYRFHDGGGRELAYVAMSRARQHSTVHVVADDVEQAAEDLHRDWADERRPRWVIDTGTPETNALRAERSPDVPVDVRTGLRRAGQEAENHASGELPAPETAPSPAFLRQRLGDTNRQLLRLEQATGPFDDPELTAAAHTLNVARNRAQSPGERPPPPASAGSAARWQREGAAGRAAEHDAAAAWTALAEPRRRQLTEQIHRLEETARSLRADPEHARVVEIYPTLEQLARTGLDATSRPGPQILDLGRFLPHSGRPVDPPDLGLEL